MTYIRKTTFSDHLIFKGENEKARFFPWNLGHNNVREWTKIKMWTFIIDTVHLEYLKWRPCLRFRSLNSGRMQKRIVTLSHRGYCSQRMRSYYFSLWFRQIKVSTLRIQHLGVVLTTNIENYARPFVVMGELMY